MDDRVLIERYLSGEESAMEEIMVKYQKSVYGLAYRLTWDKEESKDITQQTFTQVIKNLAKFRKESLFKTWLYKIAINLSLNYKGRHFYKQEELKESIAGNQVGALSLLIRKEKTILFKKALSEVPERQRLAIVLRTYQELSCREVADVMGISEGAVKANYHNGVKKLKDLLSKHGHETQP
jgi:RNA polymerase sigma-70 factor (ECF subfamily)